MLSKIDADTWWPRSEYKTKGKIEWLKEGRKENYSVYICVFMVAIGVFNTATDALIWTKYSNKDGVYEIIHGKYEKYGSII